MSRTPLYLSIAAGLRGKLAANDPAPGELLPTEADLAVRHGVSRVTVRKALGRLKAEGLIDSRQGFGWYAVAAPLRQSLRELTTIEAQIAASGQVSERRIVSFAFLPAPPAASRTLGVDSVLEFSRVNLADGRPFARVTVWVPESLAGHVSRRAVAAQPLYALLGFALGGATQTITAVGAGAGDAELLGLPEGSPLLCSERTTTDLAGRPVVLSEAVFNPLVTEFVADLPASGDDEVAGLRLLR